ncbi:hypothetical protein Ancab_002355, partial [Ancistrocladus abbreviatus]
MANKEESSHSAPRGAIMEALLAEKAPPSSTPVTGVVSSDVTVDPSRSLWFRLYVPTSAVAAADAVPVVVYYHGGGFVLSSPDLKLYDDLCRGLARELSAVVLSASHRMAPEHRCPTQYDDGFETLKFIDRAKIDGFPPNADIGKCFLAGDSSGGNMSHHMAVRAAKHEFQKLRILGIILIQPFFGAEKRSESELEFEWNPIITLERADFVWKQFLPEGSNRDHPAVNVFGSKSKDISRIPFPATLVVTSGLDLLRDWSRRYYEWLVKSGKEAKLIEYPKVPHAFYAFQHVPEAHMLINEIKEFVSVRTSSTTTTQTTIAVHSTP